MGVTLGVGASVGDTVAVRELVALLDGEEPLLKHGVGEAVLRGGHTTDLIRLFPVSEMMIWEVLPLMAMP